MTAVCEPFPDVGDTGEGVRPGDGFLAGHSRRAASLVVQDRTAEGSIVGPHPDTAKRAEHGADDRDAATGRGSVAEQLAAVEPIVRRVCRTRLGPADGDDAAQQTLVKLWRRLESGPPIESLPTYAAVYARYEALASVRGFVARPTVAVGDLTEWAWADETPGPEVRAVRAEEAAEATARVEKLLAGLTPRQAEVLRATKLADQDDTDVVAADLGIAASSVRSNLVRAMARLREACGTRSPNPLALPGTPHERARTREVAARAAGEEYVRPTHPRTREQDEFAEQVRRCRTARGVSQAGLARAMGLAEGSYLCRVERGRAWPGPEFVRRLDEALATGDTLRESHSRHRAAATTTDTTSPEAALSERVQAGRATEADAAYLPPADLDLGDGPASVAACATAGAAVQAVAECNALAEEEGRAEQLSRWHADDHPLSLTDDAGFDAATTAEDADTDAQEWSWSA